MKKKPVKKIKKKKPIKKTLTYPKVPVTCRGGKCEY